MRKTVAALTALLLGGQLCFGIPAAAEAAPVSDAFAGDVDGNYLIDRRDVELLQQCLFGDWASVQKCIWRAADLNGDRCLDARDLTLLKRLVLNPAEKSLIEPPVRILEPSLPSVGVNRIPVFAVSFPDHPFSENAAAWLQRNCFGEELSFGTGYAPNSVTAYYDCASYGRMHLTGDVFSYTAKHPIDDYAADHAQSLAEEILEALDTQLDYTDYDADRNDLIDTVMLALPDTVLEIDRDGDKRPDWWPFSGTPVSQKTYDGLRIGHYCVVAYDQSEQQDFVRKAAHELGHAMGLPDYYRYTADAFGETEGMPGVAGNELMDEGQGDLSACSKLLLGWLAEDEVQIYTGGTQTFELASLQCTPSCLLIPREPDAGFLSEYFLVEYNTKDANNAEYGQGGIRILHVQAEVSEGKHGMEFRYNNYGKYYDKSNEKQRVLRLVNEYGMYYPGLRGLRYADSVDGSLESFHWYDENGDLTAETGLKIRIDGPHYEQETFSPTNSRIPSNLRGTYAVTVSEAE